MMIYKEKIGTFETFLTKTFQMLEVSKSPPYKHAYGAAIHTATFSKNARFHQSM